MKRKMILIVISLSALPLIGQGTMPAHASGKITPMACPFDTTGLDTQIACGWVNVPEDRDEPDGAQIEIAYALVHSLNPNPQPDPVIYLEGGPGGQAIEAVPKTLQLMGNLLLERDMVFIDVRGVGHSKPALHCEGFTHAVIAALGDETASEAERKAAADTIRGCRASLEDAGIDLEHFTTHHTAGDIEVVAQALGYEEWNLYGVSYGTLVALMAMRDFPDDIRSVILDSTLPPDIDQIADGIRSTPVAFANLFEECAADLLCRTAYPDPKGILTLVVKRLDAAPVSLTLDDGSTMTLGGAGFNDMLTLLISHPDYRWQIPATIYEAQAGNYEAARDVFSMLRKMTADDSGGGQEMGLAYALMCQEIAPFTSEQTVNEAVRFAVESGTSPGPTLGIYDVCKVWGIRGGNPAYREPVRSELPVLMLVGLRDLNTPPGYAHHTAETLPNARLVEFPAAGHGVRNYGDCPVRVMAKFLDQPAVMPDTSCIPPGLSRFSISTAPTRPIALTAAAISLIGGVIAIIGLAGIGRQVIGHKQTTWASAWKRAGWKMPAATLVLVATLMLVEMTGQWGFELFDIASVIVASVMGIQTALMASATDEPGLEMIMATPRPLAWLVLERMAVVALGLLPVALAGDIAVAIIEPGTNLLALAACWLTAGVFLSGAAGFLTVRANHPGIGIMIVVLAGLVAGVAQNALLPNQAPGLPWAAPLDLIQPLLWMVHPFLKPDSLTLPDYITNRLIVTGIGFWLLWRMSQMLNDPERLLPGIRKS